MGFSQIGTTEFRLQCGGKEIGYGYQDYADQPFRLFSVDKGQYVWVGNAKDCTTAMQTLQAYIRNNYIRPAHQSKPEVVYLG